MSEIMTMTEAPALVYGQPLDQNPALVYLAGLSEGSRGTMRQALDTMAGLLTGEPDALQCNWPAVRFQHAAALRSRLAEEYAPASVNKMLSALRGVLRAAWLLGQMSAEDYHKAAAVEGIKAETLPAGRELSSGEIGALMGACEADPSPAGARDAAIVALLYGAGLRRSEVVALELCDVCADEGKLTIRAAKGRKDRTSYLANGAAAALADWLQFRGDEPGPLFWPVNKGGSPEARRLSTQAVYGMLSKRAGQAGVADFSPHDLRRTFVGHLLAAGADLSVVAKLAGHANVQTTARYDRRPEEAKREAARMLHVPYRGRGTCTPGQP